MCNVRDRDDDSINLRTGKGEGEMIMTAESIRESLHITSKDSQVYIIEKLFCAAILSEGTDAASRILKHFIEMRDLLKGGCIG